MSPAHRIRVKIGQNEFEAEGPEDLVKEQFAMFLDMAKASSVPPAKEEQTITAGSGNGNGGNPAAAQSIPQEMLDRVFIVDQDQVSLRLLPRSGDREANALVVLLYGFRKLCNQTDVLVGRLLKAAKTSGISIDRVDYAIAPNAELVTKGGARVGSRYGLNNRGVVKAEEIISEMLH